MGKKSDVYEKDGIIFKKCTGCGEFKEATTEFYSADKKCALGLKSKCKECVKECNAKYHSLHKDEINKRHKEYYYNNIEYFKEHAKKYHAEHKEELNERGREWYYNNRERSIQYSINYLKTHKDKKKANDKKYYDTHEEKIRERNKKYREENKVMLGEKSHEWYLKNKDRIAEYKKKYNGVHDKVHKWKEEYEYTYECSLCGCTDNIEFHHPDYNFWNIGIFVCISCHKKIHSGKIKHFKTIDLLNI